MGTVHASPFLRPASCSASCPHLSLLRPRAPILSAFIKRDARTIPPCPFPHLAGSLNFYYNV
jgi:hypothetical protein